MEIYKVKPLPFAYNALEGISEQQLKYHHDTHYAAYVTNRNKIEEQLDEMRKKGDFPNIRGLKLNESHNASGMILHEVYWDTLGEKGGEPKGKLAEKMKQDFDSIENWKKNSWQLQTLEEVGFSYASTQATTDYIIIP